jgi:hypothetical protein
MTKPSTKNEKNEEKKKKPAEGALPERLLRRLLEGMGAAVDRGLGREVETKSGLTTNMLLERMKLLIDERVRDEGAKGQIAPHHLKLKIEWGTHSEAAPDVLEALEHEVLAAARDPINDHRYRTLAPMDIETEVDIFITGIAVDPTFGEFEEELRQADEERRRAAELGKVDIPKAAPKLHEVNIVARATLPDGPKEKVLSFKPGGRRVSVGRGSDNDLHLNDNSVSKIHAALVMNREGTLMVADTGSTNGTFINGRRIAYGESRQIEDGDVVGFGNIEVRFRRA